MARNREYQNERKRVKRARVHTLRNALLLQAELLCDSHSIKYSNADAATYNSELMARIFATVLELMQQGRLSEERKKSFGDSMFKCAYRDELLPNIVIDGNMISIRGEFDLRELAKRMVWGEIAEELRQVEEVNE